MSKTADLSSDNERNSRYPPSSWATSSAYSVAASSPEVIVILDSDDDEYEKCLELVVSCAVKREPKKREEITTNTRAIKCEVLFFLCCSFGLLLMTTGLHSISPEIQFLSDSPVGIRKKTAKGKAQVLDVSPEGSGPIKITSKLTVDSMSTITSLPSMWTVPWDNSATLVDLSAWHSFPQRPNGDRYLIDALIRAEVCLNLGPRSDNWLFSFYCRIKTPGGVQLVTLPEKSMSSGSMKMIPQRASTAVVHTFTATVLLYASTLIRISSEAASTMNLILMRCESSGIMSLMLTLTKRSRKWTLFRGIDQLLT